MTGKIVGTKGVDYNNPPSFREVEEIYQEIKSSLPRELNAEEKWQKDFAEKQKQWRAQQEVDAYYDSCDSEIYGDQFADYEEEEAAEKEREKKEQEEFEQYLKDCDATKACEQKEKEIKQLQYDELDIKGKCDTKRKAQLRHRILKNMRKKDIVQNNMTKEEAQKVIPTLDLGDDIEEVPKGEEEIITKYSVIKKDDGSTLHPDWKVIWKKEDFSRVKYYNPTFKLEIFEKPIKGKDQFSNKHIRNNLKKVYENEKDESKIIVWNPEREQGMVDIYEKLVDNSEPINTLFTNIEDRSEQEKAQSVITMGWDDTDGNERPYYKYKQGFTKKIVTYEPPIHLLSSLSYSIRSIRGVYTNEKVSAAEAGPASGKGGKRKTQKKKQPKQKRAGSTKKAKKGGKKTSQKKGKQQKRGTRGKK